MKANELRIGNWVMGNKPFRVDGVNIALYEQTIKALDSERWLPIPLTEEWLIKFGFEKIKNNGIDYELHDCVISFEAKWMFTSESYQNEVRTLIPKHVHQLQNLYFALTNEELTIKL